MTFVNVTGGSLFTSTIDYAIGGLGTNLVMDATAEKLAMIGSVWHPTVKTGTINIRKVLFRTGAITANFAGGTQVRVSLQNISATAGPPYQPDGVQDQFYDFKTATTTLSSNTWHTTGNLSADRVIDLSADSLGDANSRQIAVVWEFNVFSASDSIIVNTYTYAGQLYGSDAGIGGIALLNTGTWAAVGQRLNNVMFECDDGTFAFLSPSMVITAASSVSVSSSGAIRRAGAIFKLPFTCKVDKAALALQIPNGSDGSIALYDSDGTTVLASVDIDNDAILTAATSGYTNVQFPAVTLLANTDYRLVFVGGTTTASQVLYNEVAVATYLNNYPFGSNLRWTQHDGSNWAADTTTRAPFFGLGICALDDGTGNSPTYRLGI